MDTIKQIFGHDAVLVRELSPGVFSLDSGDTVTLLSEAAGGGGGGGTPSLPFNSVQFNNAGALGGSALFEFDGTQIHIGPAESTLPAALNGWVASASTPLLITSLGDYSALQVKAALGAYGSAILCVMGVTSGTATAIEGDVSLGVNGVSGYGISAYGQVEAGIAATTLAGLHVWDPWFDSGGSVVNLYGLLIQDQTLGANNWAIKTGLGVVDFGDRVRIGPAESVLPATIQGWTLEANTELFIISSKPQAINVAIASNSAQAFTATVASLNTNPGVSFYSNISLGVTNGQGVGLLAYAEVEAGISAALSKGVWINDVYKYGGSSLVDNYGISIDDMIAGTNNWAIKTGKGLVEFGDQVTIKSFNDGATLNLTATSDGYIFSPVSFNYIAQAGEFNPADGTSAVAGTTYQIGGLFYELDPTGADPRKMDMQISLGPVNVLIAVGDGSVGIGKAHMTNPGGLDQISSATLIVGANDTVTCTKSLTTTACTVATLPAFPVAGQRAFVTDSNAVSYTAGIGAVLAAGGSTKVPCVYDGTNWRIG